MTVGKRTKITLGLLAVILPLLVSGSMWAAKVEYKAEDAQSRSISNESVLKEIKESQIRMETQINILMRFYGLNEKEK